MDLQLLSPFIQLVTNAAPRLKYGMALAWEQQLRAFEPDAFGHKITDAVAEQYRKAKWLLPMQGNDRSIVDAAGIGADKENFNLSCFRTMLEGVLLTQYPEFKNWHADLNKMRTSAWLQAAIKTSPDVSAMLDHSDQIVLLQPLQVVQLCNSFMSSLDSALEVRRLQNFVAAVARISLRQRMLLVFHGYRARFARIGATTSGDLDYLEEVDLLALGLPSVAHDIMVKSIQTGLCKPPIVLDFGAAVQDLQAPLEGLLERFGLISVIGVFHKKDMHTVQDAATLSEADVLRWQSLFAKQLPCRKLKKLVLSLPINLWYEQLNANGLLPSGCHTVRDLPLYDVDQHWKIIHAAWALKTSFTGIFTSFSYARPQPEVSMFKQHASRFVSSVGQQDKLQEIWYRLGFYLEKGFGLRSSEDLLALHRGDLDELTGFVGIQTSNFCSSVVSHYLNGLVDAEVERPRRFLPVMADVKAGPASGLGRLMDWLVHPDVSLAAYYPFITQAGVDQLQDLSRLQLDLVQPYMLPWDARHFVACISDLFSEDRFYSTLEPSLFCSPGSTASLVWPAGAMWLVTSFFANYSEALAHPDIDVTCPADTAFLTQVDLNRLDWGQLCGAAWKHSVQTALKQISLEDYYKLCVQRFPQALASVGVYEADDLRWLEPAALTSLKGLLSCKMWQWMKALIDDTQPPDWKPFEDNALPPDTELERWGRHAGLPARVKIPECLGARAVTDLEHVSPDVQLTVMRPVQQARLRWALCSYQAQLAQERQKQQDRAASPEAAKEQKQNERDKEFERQKEFEEAKSAAQKQVAAAYDRYRSQDDVHNFMKDLSHLCDKLGGELPAKPARGSKSWKSEMLNVFRSAYLMAHPDKYPDITQHAMATEVFKKLQQWQADFNRRH